MAPREQAEPFLTGLQDSVVQLGLDSGLPASVAVDLALRYAVELHANNLGVEATSARLEDARKRGFKGLLSELGAVFTSRRCDA